jgi:transposase
LIDSIWKTEIPGFDFSIKKNKLDCPSLLPNDFLKQFDSWLSARMKQCVGKQACSMVKAAVKKRSKQLYKLRELQKEHNNTKHLQRRIDVQPLVKPDARRANAELDSRFIDFKENSQHFDFFTRLKQVGNKLSFNLPIKHTKVSRRWLGKGELKQTARLSDSQLFLIFNIPKPPKKKDGKKIGCDQGYLTVASLSDGQVTKADKAGYNLEIMQEKLSRKKKGSKSFKKVQEHRKNYINWSINQLNLSDISELRCEKIKYLRRGVKSSRIMTHWTYTLIKKKFVSLSDLEGCQVTEVPNEFRSQRCNRCGWVRKANRKGKTFECDVCGFTADADLNAASNLELDLFEIPWWVRSKKINMKGFYWNSDGLFSESWESIVPGTKEA